MEVTRILLVNGGDIRLQKTWAGTPLHCAARKGLTNFAHLLLNHGADINSKDFHRKTPLHDAVSGNHPHMVKFLISKGADVNAVADFEPPQLLCVPVDYKSWGLTPLHMAAREGSLEIVRILVDGGASIDSRTRNFEEHMEPQGLTAFDLAFRSRREKEHRYQAILGLVAFRSPEQIERYLSDMEERFRKIADMYKNNDGYPKVTWIQPLEELHRKEVEEPYAMLLKLIETEVRRT
jgi:hypothetical protein